MERPRRNVNREEGTTMSSERARTLSRTVPRLVTAEDLERQIASLRRTSTNPQAGLFGPQSVVWRIDREAITFLGAGRALLLQLAHPWVAAAVAAHSRAFADPIGRFHRTFHVVFTMVFGTVDQAFDMARRLHRRHATITGVLPSSAGPFLAGSPYWANDTATLRWVHMTLMDTALTIHELMFGPLSVEDRAQYYAESCRLAALFGIPRDHLPEDWSGFAAEMAAMLDSPVLTVSREAHTVARRIFAAPILSMRLPAWYLDLTAEFMPPRLREGFELDYGVAARRRAARALVHIRWLYPRLPARLRHVGPYQEAVARLAGKSAPGAGVRLLNRIWIGRPRLGM